MKGAIKIIVIILVAAASFAGYMVVFGKAMGVSSPQILAALTTTSKPQQEPMQAKIEKAMKDSVEVALSDSGAVILPISDSAVAAGPMPDTLGEQLAKIGQEKAELEKLRNEIKSLMIAKSKTDSLRIAGLAKMYDGVEPTQLAAVIANMDDSLVIAILPRLKTQKAGKVLETMPAERAARISSKLLGAF